MSDSTLDPMAQEDPIIVWADAAKALCIVLVILLHSGQVTPAPGWDNWEAIRDAWDCANQAIRPIRMPTFFLISGMLTSRSILQPRPDTLWKRAVKPAYIYYVWAAIFITVIPSYPSPAPSDLGLLGRLARIVCMSSPAWYMLGLTAFYCVASVSRNWSLPFVLMGCAALSLVGSLLQESLGIHAMICRCLVFFVAGVRLKSQILRFASTASRLKTLLAACFYAVAAWLTVSLDRFLLPVDMLAVAFVVQFVSLAVRKFPVVIAPTRWLGQRTLFVYLLHFPLLVFLTSCCRAYLDMENIGGAATGMIFPLIVGVLVLLTSLVLGEGLQKIGLGRWLFDLPPALRYTRNGKAGANRLHANAKSAMSVVS